jgi:hypothetical protein
MDEQQFSHEFLACFMCRTINSTGTGYLMRSKDYNENGGLSKEYPNLIFADYALWIDISLLSFKATSPYKTFKYRIHNSISKTTNGEEYQKAFEVFLNFLIQRKQNEKIKMVIERYGKEMLLYHCESLSHRILKTPVANRKIAVKEFIEKCKQYAETLIPGQHFQPLKIFRIKIAEIFDRSSFNRSFFKIYKKLSS